ncbi:hypothetical protein [Novosphingobium sp. Gsoil 351]|uniref:hypothetical protein n=1 Tax=Novosphingobium sp. Gsoil 351 TaxID=2675225 RepID=UPI0012B482D3|nr:hypothetical protein [Novosphingobium sp. Gsoil 351]QGN54935.1 hypothetical protein GKE62_10605 [Novosphingobium sp. Gsoil 351]
MRKLLTAAAAAFLVAGTGAHAAAPVRAAAPIENASEMSGEGLPLSVILVLAAVLGGAIYLLVDGNDSPDSP